MPFKSFVYPAVVKRAGRKHAIVFPDLPGCVGIGGNVEESALNAENSLLAYLEGVVHGGRSPPTPSRLDDMCRLRNGGELGFMLVRAEVGPKVVRINISLDEAILARADREAAQQGYTRSGYIASLIRNDVPRKARRLSSPKAKSKPKRRRAG
jgi:predicted RNase H-like HicB family nuclease